MKKRVFILAAALLLVPPGNFLQGGIVSLELKGSYFQPTEKAFKDIYGNGQTYGGEIGVAVWRGLTIWASGDYFSKKGKMTFTEEETKIQIIPICAGIKYQYQILSDRISPYIGLGVGHFSYKEENPIGTVKKGNIGFMGKAGLSFKVLSGFFLDIQVDFTSCKVKPADIKADLGGLQAGIGLGFAF